MTVSAIVAEPVMLPEVPVIVTVTGPPAVAVEVAVSCRVVDAVAGLVEKAAVTPDGRPVAAKVTMPEKPLSPVMVRLSDAVAP